MTEGSLVLARLPQADGALKSRPALVLRPLPPFGDLLVCGVSSQLRHEVLGFDEVLTSASQDFVDSGLYLPSLIRLGYLGVLPLHRVIGEMGRIAPERHRRLLQRLSDFLKP